MKTKAAPRAGTRLKSRQPDHIVISAKRDTVPVQRAFPVIFLFRNRLHATVSDPAEFDNLGGRAVPDVSMIRSDEPAEFAASVKGFEARYLPTTSDHRFVKFELSLGSGRLAVSTRPPMLYEGTVVANEGVVCFHLEDDLRANVNGHSVGADTIALWKKGTDYRAYQQSRITHCALFVSDAFSVRDWPEPAPTDRFMWIGADSSSRLRSCVSNAVEVIRRDPGRLANPNVVKGIDHSIIGGIDEALSTVVLSASGVATGRYVAICKRAEEYLRESRFRIHSSPEVARACGVTPRTLHNALVAVLGVSPGRYLLLHRLWLVRNALLRASPDALVKSIALDHGFWHLGRFSSLYCARFGESPSTTLAKGHSEPWLAADRLPQHA
jgi:AraC family ethanolamine operon transcriptional activator